jgi:hypothetical protein
VLEALHENSLPFLNGGQPVPVPTVGIGLSLSIIIGVLTITTVASLVKAKRDPSVVHPPGAAPAVVDAPDAPDDDADDADDRGGATRAHSRTHVPGRPHPDPTRA